MTYEMKKAYAEVSQILENLPQEYKNKIPNKILQILETEKLNDYKIAISPQNPVDRTKLTKQTLVILALLNYQYWCPNRNVRNTLYKIYSENEKIYQTHNSIHDLFENKPSLEKNLSMVEYKPSVFAKIINWFRKFIT